MTVPELRTGTIDQFFFRERKLLTSSFLEHWYWSPVLFLRTGTTDQFFSPKLEQITGHFRQNLRVRVRVRVRVESR
jgi:hypothetical protein